MPTWNALPLWAKIILVPVIIVACLQLAFLAFGAVCAVLGLVEAAVAKVAQ